MHDSCSFAESSSQYLAIESDAGAVVSTRRCPPLTLFNVLDALYEHHAKFVARQPHLPRLRGVRPLMGSSTDTTTSPPFGEARECARCVDTSSRHLFRLFSFA